MVVATIEQRHPHVGAPQLFGCRKASKAAADEENMWDGHVPIGELLIDPEQPC